MLKNARWFVLFKLSLALSDICELGDYTQKAHWALNHKN